MTRSISPSMAPVLERLELDRPEVVTTAGLAAILADVGVATPTRVVAARLRGSGWLLTTGQRGVWEFVPAESAGVFSRGDPVMPLKSFLAAHPDSGCALTFQAGAWAHGLADRTPSRLEIAVPGGAQARRLPDVLQSSVFAPVLPTLEIRGVPVLRPVSILVHMTTRPSDVRSWASAGEWLPDLAAEVAQDDLAVELADRPQTVRARTGYLLQGLRPDLAMRIREGYGVAGKTWFGPRGPLLHHDSAWQVADTLLPFDPRRSEAVM